MREKKSPPENRFCDLVMKGGIASGVVYPAAIVKLSEHYFFKSIGGTSVGAIAAALTAAAEFNRRRNSGSGFGFGFGFDVIEGIPDNLQEEVGNNRRRILTLFQPQAGTRRLFSVLIATINRGGPYSRLLACLVGIFRSYWMVVVGCCLLAGFCAWISFPEWLVGSMFVLLLFCALIGAVCWDVARNFVGNGFGLCKGLTEDTEHVALTPWLHGLIQRAAGLGEAADPLTFGMLWSVKGFPFDLFPSAPGAVRKSIDLQMFSTNLTHGRPYIFPLADPGGNTHRVERLFFHPDELKDYLPSNVLGWLCRTSRPYGVQDGLEEVEPSVEVLMASGLRELPRAEDFPVILAARMSLSFPFLFSAVPLWAIDPTPVGPNGRGTPRFRKCWFSDGGLSSNFPIHLFDGLVPSWPTFGINLESEERKNGRKRGLQDEYLEAWDYFCEKKSGRACFGGYLSSIIGAMQNWNDNALSRMPGFRDRIARVSLAPDEGGLNINMEARTIRRLAKKGEDAANDLIYRFALAPAPDNGWDDQRWVRLGCLLKMIQDRAPSVMAAFDPKCPHATDFNTLITASGLSAVQQTAWHDLIQALDVMVHTFSGPNNALDFKPVPKPELRVRPPL